MQHLLRSELNEYLITHYPDLLLGLQEKGKVQSFLDEKIIEVTPLLHTLEKERIPSYIIKAKCMEWLMEQLEPSKFLYVKQILEEEFEKEVERWRQLGILTYEVINIIIAAVTAFEQFPLKDETEDNRFLRYVIIGTIKEYLESQHPEGSDGV